MKKTVLSALLMLAVMSLDAQHSSLRTYGDAVQLMVDGNPFIVLGGELGNSSASCAEDIESNFSKLHEMGLNTVLVPAYWDLLEPVEGQFDFSLTDKVLEEARKNDLKVVFLWFKQDYKKYPRAYTAEGKPLEIASAFSENVFNADNAVAGNGIVVEFKTAEPDTWCGIGSVDEVEVNPDGTFSYIRRLNGDQDHQGRHVRISVGDYKVLHVKLYEYR